MNVFVFIGLAVLVVLFLFRNRKKKSSRSLPVHVDSRHVYMSSFVPALLEDYKVFSSSYLSRYASQYKKSERFVKFTEKDLLPGVDIDRAIWVYNHCERLAVARYNNLSAISNAEKADASAVALTVSRACPGCSHVPKNKTYKFGTNIPIYPCADCQEDKPCDIWYKAVF